MLKLGLQYLHGKSNEMANKMELHALEKLNNAESHYFNEILIVN